MTTATKTIDLNKPDAASAAGAELEVTATALATRLGDAVIRDVVDLEQAALDRRAIGDQIDRIEEFFAPLKKMAHDLHKGLCNRESAILAPLRRVDIERSDAIKAFKRKADAEREAAEREQAAQRTRDDEARAIAAAAVLEADGDTEMAAAVMEEAISAPAAVVALPDLTRAAGIGFTRRWRWRIPGGDEARALRLVPRDFLMLDKTKINAFVRNMKTSAKIPGIEVYYDDEPRR